MHFLMDLTKILTEGVKCENDIYSLGRTLQPFFTCQMRPSLLLVKCHFHKLPNINFGNVEWSINIIKHKPLAKSKSRLPTDQEEPQKKSRKVELRTLVRNQEVKEPLKVLQLITEKILCGTNYIIHHENEA